MPIITQQSLQSSHRRAGIGNLGLTAGQTIISISISLNNVGNSTITGETGRHGSRDSVKDCSLRVVA